MLFGDRFGAAARGAGASRAARRALLALVGAGAIIACAPSAASAATPKWRTLSQSKASTTSLSPAAVDCTSTRRCVTAVVRYAGRRRGTLVTTRVGRRTSTRLVHGLIADSLTCRGKFCAAGGYASAGSDAIDATVSFTLGGHWARLARIPGVPDASADGSSIAIWIGISCATAHNCLAVGMNMTLSESTDCPGGSEDEEGFCLTSSPLVGHLSDGTWQQIGTVPVPDPTIPGAASAALVDVHCASTRDCVAVGEYGSGASKLFAEHWNGISLTATAMPAPGWSNDNETDSLACDRHGNCLAVGSAQKGSRTLPLTLRLHAGHWRIVRSPLPRGARDASLAAVACAPSGTCMAVGSRQRTAVARQLPLAEIWRGGRLRVLPVPATRAAGRKDNNELDAVSCPDGNFCEALGDYVNPAGFSLSASGPDSLVGALFGNLIGALTGTKGGWFTDVYSKTA